MKVHVNAKLMIKFGTRNGFKIPAVLVNCEKEYEDGWGIKDEALVVLELIKLPCCNESAGCVASVDIGKKTVFIDCLHEPLWKWDSKNDKHSWKELKKIFLEDGWKIENITSRDDLDFLSSDGKKEHWDKNCKEYVDLWLS